MRTICGRVLSTVTKQDDLIVRLASLGGHGIIIVRIETEDIADKEALPLVFPTMALALFRGYYCGTNGFNAHGFEVMPREFQESL
jgi:hypothetical protein